mmetsp:Transcript_13230/g.31097  ORF Transcript_13230/g.31097 Transcript_13230/m.31097 type:complete len:83 (-) Transcript_13230:2546-2794(-)
MLMMMWRKYGFGEEIFVYVRMRNCILTSDWLVINIYCGKKDGGNRADGMSFFHHMDFSSSTPAARCFFDHADFSSSTPITLW